METHDALKERVRREQRLAARLRLATECLEAAQQERTWAIVESHQSGFSIRQIASATGLSSSRVHQLLGSDESREIPRWLSQQRGLEAVPSQGHSDLQARLAGEMEALRRCRGWLERLERGEIVVVNLRPETDPETEYVSFDRPRVLRVLSRIFADLDELAGFPPIADDEGIMGENVEARRVRHPKRLTEPDPPPKRLCMREERAALRTLLDLPPSEGGERACPGTSAGRFGHGTRLRPLQRITHSGSPLLKGLAVVIPLVFPGESHFLPPCGAGSLAVGKRSGCGFRHQGRTNSGGERSRIDVSGQAPNLDNLGGVGGRRGS